MSNRRWRETLKQKSANAVILKRILEVWVNQSKSNIQVTLHLSEHQQLPCGHIPERRHSSLLLLYDARKRRWTYWNAAFYGFVADQRGKLALSHLELLFMNPCNLGKKHKETGAAECGLWRSAKRKTLRSVYFMN